MTVPKLFHVSDDPDIEVFEPRPHATWPDLGRRVWAIEERLLHNYLLPRDCPRVTFYATDTSTDADVEGYLGGNRTKHVVRVEEAWMDRIKTARLYLYELPPLEFSCFDEGAGYWVNQAAVTPANITEVSDLPRAIADRMIDFDALPNLWALHDAVAASTLQFSMIRMRFAAERSVT